MKNTLLSLNKTSHEAVINESKKTGGGLGDIFEKHDCTSRDLEVKNRKLNYLYAFCQITKKCSAEVESLINDVLQIIPKAFQHPEITVCKIVFESNESQTEHFKQTKWAIEKEIYEHGKVIGKIIVCYLEENNFLEEEKKLLDLICEGFSNEARRIKYENISKKVTSQLHHTSKLASIGELTTRIAHEISNPLAIIFGALDILKYKHPGEIKDIYPLISTITQSCSRIQNLISGSSLFAMPNDNKFTTIDLHEATNQLLTAIEIVYKNEGITISKDLNAKAPFVFGNHGEIQQVLMNLLTNSRDALIKDEKDREIKISTNNINNNLILIFSDNGRGIHPFNINKIFENHFTTKNHKKGAGLGLSISDSIIKKMGGEIKVESKLNEGTKFTIIIPTQNSTTVCKTKDFSSDERSFSGCVLVVDNEITLRAILSNTLVKMGFKVKEAKDDQEALSLLEKSNYDYLITNFRASKGNEFELAKIAKKRGYVKKVIIISDTTITTDEREISKNFDATIKKPFKTADITKTIKQLQSSSTTTIPLDHDALIKSNLTEPFKKMRTVRFPLASTS